MSTRSLEHQATPSPKRDDDSVQELPNDEPFATPLPPPVRPPSENATTFKRRKFRTSPITPRRFDGPSPTDSLTSSTTNSAESRPPAERSKLPRLYLGKETHVGTFGQFGPGMYDVRCSKTGSPLRGSKGTPRLSFAGPRFSREKCCEGKETEHLLLGQFGPGMYDVKCFNTGSPRGGSKGTPRFGSGARFDREKCYEGKENEYQFGQFGPGMYDIRCFNTGSPRGGGKGTPRFGSGARFDREKCYEGKEHVRFGREGPTASYDPPRCSNRGSPLWKMRTSAAFALPHVRGALRSNPA